MCVDLYGILMNSIMTWWAVQALNIKLTMAWALLHMTTFTFTLALHLLQPERAGRLWSDLFFTRKFGKGSKTFVTSNCCSHTSLTMKKVCTPEGGIYLASRGEYNETSQACLTTWLHPFDLAIVFFDQAHTPRRACCQTTDKVLFGRSLQCPVCIVALWLVAWYQIWRLSWSPSTTRTSKCWCRNIDSEEQQIPWNSDQSALHFAILTRDKANLYRWSLQQTLNRACIGFDAKHKAFIKAGSRIWVPGRVQYDSV